MQAYGVTEIDEETPRPAAPPPAPLRVLPNIGASRSRASNSCAHQAHRPQPLLPTPRPRANIHPGAGSPPTRAYRVRSPVATIGIRGTDYDAVFCEAACEPDNTGLYLGVTEGMVVLTNAAGSLELGPGQYGYVADEDSAPEISADGVDVLAAGMASLGENEEDDAEVQVAVAITGTDVSGQSASLIEGIEVQASQSGLVGFAVGPLATAGHFKNVTSGTGTSILMTDAGDLVNFSGAISNNSQGSSNVASYGVGSAENLDRGEDAASGIRWGRWANGSISVLIGNGNSTDQDLGNSSLHWVTGPVDQPTPVLPTAGTATVTLVGTTHATENAVKCGTRRSVSLSAGLARAWAQR